MGIASLLLQRFALVEIRRLLMIIGMAITIIALFQCFALPYGKRWSLSSYYGSPPVLLISNATFSINSKSSKVHVFDMVSNDTDSSGLEEGVGDGNEIKDANLDYNLASNKIAQFTLKMGVTVGKSSIMEYVTSKDDSSTQQKAVDGGSGHLEQAKKVENMEAITGLTFGGLKKLGGMERVELPGISANNGENKDTDSRTSDSFFPTNVHSMDLMETQPKNTELMQAVSDTLNKNSTRTSIVTLKRWKVQPTSISQMNSLLLQSFVSSRSTRMQWSSIRDRELLSAKLWIENAPFVRSIPGLHASAFRNVSMFKRSYELMEHMLKVYIYKEGEKPIFHQSKMRGIYASEGWFMKLIEENRKFVVRDPRKAHLFYLPFSSQMLRIALFEQNFQSRKELEEYLKNYVDLIAHKYGFWNRTGGADHFLVGCHDWASQITTHHMKNCIRALCNANVAKGFKIGKDTSLPVTYVRSVKTPLNDLGGKPPSERPILAFFAGGMHGYLRPMLLQYWENKEPDMKIFGPMPRDIESKKIYRGYMKSSKYCICARGYEVHTPRVVEAIFYECVPVIISDNYVPPFFEVLNWETFSVFVQEKDIPNLRNILLSIPEEKYLAMQLSVKMVQQHFLWHKKPIKYDLFHMILHSIWHNRVFQMKSR